MRLAVGPSSAYTVATTRVDGSSPSLFCALAAALAMTLATGSLAACGAHRKMCSASVTDLPRTRSMTRRALVAETRTKRALATADGYSVVILIAVLCSSRKRSSLSFALRASAHRCPLLFAQALIAVLCSSRKRSSLSLDERAQPDDRRTH